MKKTSRDNINQEHFFFIRHAETSWNDKKLCQGQKDIPLNEKGILEAKNFAIQAQDLNLDCIITSPLMRAIQTAEEIHYFHQNAKFHIIPQLSERNWGELEGISSTEMYAIEQHEEEDPSYIPGRGVEPRHAFRERVLRGILEAQQHSPHPFIVGHGRVFMELCHILKVPPIRQISNCQLIKIRAIKSKWETEIVKEVCK